MAHFLAPQAVLIHQSRLARIAGAAGNFSVLQAVVPFGCGLLATAAVIFIDDGVRLPGHAILRAVLPLALGLALVPRRGSGLIAGGGALAGLGLAGLMGLGPGTGATTSLVLTGPLLDLAASRTRSGWRLYAAFGLAALASNMLAFVVRGMPKLVGIGGGGRPFGEWLTIAPISYAACGLAAGLISALLFFRWSAPPQGDEAAR